MRIFRAASTILGLSILLAACSSFPTEQLSFDVSSSPVPVMLTPVAGDAATKTFSFEAGYSHATMTSQNRNAAGTASSTTTMSMGMKSNKPIKEQLDNFFIQDPAWVFLDELSVSDDHSIFNFLVVALDTYNYKTAVKLDVAASRSSK